MGDQDSGSTRSAPARGEVVEDLLDAVLGPVGLLLGQDLEGALVGFVAQGPQAKRTLS